MEQQNQTVTNRIANILSSITISNSTNSIDDSKKPSSSPQYSLHGQPNHGLLATSAGIMKKGNSSSLRTRLPTHSIKTPDKIIKRRLSNPEYSPPSTTATILSNSSSSSSSSSLTTTTTTTTTTAPFISPKLEILRNKRFRNFRKYSNSSDSSKKIKYDPYDKSALNDRINSFGILQWTIDDDDEAYDYRSDTEDDDTMHDAYAPTTNTTSTTTNNNTKRRLTPLECARYGWKCNPKKKNELICQTCHAILLVRLNNRENPDFFSLTSDAGIVFQFDEDEIEVNFMSVRKKLLNSFLNRLSKGHYSYCSWKQIATPLSVYRVSVSDIHEYLSSFEEILSTLLANKFYLSMKSFKQVLTDQQLQILSDYVESTNSDKKDISSVILTLSLLGWKLKMQKFGNKNLILLNCSKCTRRILLGEEKKSGNNNKIPSISSLSQIDKSSTSIERLPDSEYPAAAIDHGVKDIFTNLNQDPGSIHNNPNYNQSIHYYTDSNHNNNANDSHVESESDSESDGVLEDEDEIDLISEHRNWCCYISPANTTNSTSESSDMIDNGEQEDSLLGYELILRMIKASSAKTKEVLDNTTLLNSENDITIADIEAYDNSINSTNDDDDPSQIMENDSVAQSLENLHRLRRYL